MRRASSASIARTCSTSIGSRASSSTRRTAAPRFFATAPACRSAGLVMRGWPSCCSLSRMRHRFGIVLVLTITLAAIVLVSAQTTAPAPDTPAWAYGVPNAPPAGGGQRGGAPRQPDTSPKHIPDSPQTFTIPQLRDFFNVADWFPNEHPPMPEVFVHGRPPDV